MASTIEATNDQVDTQFIHATNRSITTLYDDENEYSEELLHCLEIIDFLEAINVDDDCTSQSFRHDTFDPNANSFFQHENEKGQ